MLVELVRISAWQISSTFSDAVISVAEPEHRTYITQLKGMHHFVPRACIVNNRSRF